MKLRRYSGFCMLLTLCLLSLVMTGCKDKGRIVEPKEGPAHLDIPQPVWELGQVFPQNGEIRRDVLLVNDGGEPLEITGVEPLCECIRAEYPDYAIRPGHGGRLKVFLDINQISSGPFSRSIIVNSNGGSVAVDLNGIKRFQTD